MKVVDANLLLYAVDESATQHRRALDWLDTALTSGEAVGLPWLSLLAFVRISTHPAIYERPLSVADALATVTAWLSAPAAVAPEPDARHPQRLQELLEATGRGGNLVNDAHLAALALQYGATVVTFDNDFGRFPGVRWQLPG